MENDLLLEKKILQSDSLQINTNLMGFILTECFWGRGDMIRDSCLTNDIYKENSTFIQQGCIKLIKSYCKDIYNVTKDFYFK